jgi:MFS family permease
MLARFCLYGFLKNQRYFEPFFMLFFLEQGLSFLMIGVLVAARELTVNLFEVPSGAIADSFGRRGSMVLSFAAYIVSFLIFAAASQMVWFFVAMIFFAIGDSFRTGTHKAMIFEWLRLRGEQNRRVQVYGFTRSWSQIGSALSGILAATFILLVGDYRFVFVAAVIPYALNVINLSTYPKALDGNHEKSASLRETLSRLRGTVHRAMSQRPMRQLMLESMGWEGYFNAAKDYLQIALQAFALAAFAWWLPATILNESQQSALLVGPIYGLLFLLSAFASRTSHRLVDIAGTPTAATRLLWLGNLATMVAILIVGWLACNWLVAVAFVVLHILYNLWRPILIGRFDELSEAHEGATVLSLESQAQRLCTMVAAPLLGYCVDVASRWTPGSPIWPVGALGALVAATFWLRARQATPATT